MNLTSHIPREWTARHAIAREKHDDRVTACLASSFPAVLIVWLAYRFRERQ